MTLSWRYEKVETSSFRAAQDRVWVDGFTFPEFLMIGGDQDRKMQMIIAGARVAGVTDITDDIALSHVVAHAEAGGIAVEMRIIKDQLLVGAQLINYLAAESVATDPDDLAIRGRQHRSSARDHNVYCAVDPAPGTRRVERVLQIA
jgi:hypothetical protein